MTLNYINSLLISLFLFNRYFHSTSYVSNVVQCFTDMNFFLVTALYGITKAVNEVNELSSVFDTIQ